MTYSIVARDPDTGALGVGVQTHQPCVGAIVPWVRPGIGAVATQSWANIAFGPQALALLESGLPAGRALDAILAGDDAAGRRQVAIIAATGAPAVHTGENCIPHAGHGAGEHYSVQANMMLQDTVPAAMAAAFEAATGHLAERILAALDAAQTEGGDIRGSQSAAILVKEPDGALDHRWDLRVDNDHEPLLRLRELVNVRLAGRMMSEALEQARAITDDQRARLRLLDEAHAAGTALAPSDERTFWYAVQGLAETLGEAQRAAAVLAPVFARGPQWRELLLRLEGPDLEPLKRIVAGDLSPA